MSLPNPIIGGHVYNWYECVFKFDALGVEGVLSVSGSKEKIEQALQWGTGRKPIDIVTGKVEYDPITVSMYAYEWQKVKAYLTLKSLGRGYGHAKFAFTSIATGSALDLAPPVGDIWGGCKITEVSKEYAQDANGSKVDVTFLPSEHLDIDGTSMSLLDLPGV
jgi:hypothetical protein